MYSLDQIINNKSYTFYDKFSRKGFIILVDNLLIFVPYKLYKTYSSYFDISKPFISQANFIENLKINNLTPQSSTNNGSAENNNNQVQQNIENLDIFGKLQKTNYKKYFRITNTFRKELGEWNIPFNQNRIMEASVIYSIFSLTNEQLLQYITYFLNNPPNNSTDMFYKLLYSYYTINYTIRYIVIYLIKTKILIFTF